MYNIIREAICTKQNIAATYRGRYRELSPHVIGLKNGREHALFYQFGGDSESGLDQDGSVHNWRCIPIDGLSNVSIIPGSWHTAPNYSRCQSCVDVIHLEV